MTGQGPQERLRPKITRWQPGLRELGHVSAERCDTIVATAWVSGEGADFRRRTKRNIFVGGCNPDRPVGRQADALAAFQPARGHLVGPAESPAGQDRSAEPRLTARQALTYMRDILDELEAGRMSADR